MANPQPDKFVKISTELFDHIIKLRIPGAARQCFDFIIRKTYGYNKKQDRISLSQFSIETDLTRNHVCRAIQKLEEMNLITKKETRCPKKGTVLAVCYSIQKDYEKWRGVPKKRRGVSQKRSKVVPKKVSASPKKGTKVSPKKGHTIDNKQFTIDNNTIDKGLPKQVRPEHKSVIDYFCNEYKKKFGMKYGFNGGKDGQLIKSLISKFGADRVKDLIDEIMTTDDAWIRTVGITIPILSNQSNQLAQAVHKRLNPGLLDRLSPAGQRTALAGRQALRELEEEREKSKDN